MQVMRILFVLCIFFSSLLTEKAVEEQTFLICVALKCKYQQKSGAAENGNTEKKKRDACIALSYSLHSFCLLAALQFCFWAC